MAAIDLINWTIQKVQDSKTERREAAGDFNQKLSLDKLLAELERGPAEPTEPDGSVAPGSIHHTDGETAAGPSDETAATPEAATVSDLQSVPPAAAATSPEAKRREPEPALLMAVVKPDIYTARADRDRAVALRWILRDIKSNRLKWSPVNESELRTLLDLGLVEMRNDAPVLTKAGANAII
jgi:hypothetical protein